MLLISLYPPVLLPRTRVVKTYLPPPDNMNGLVSD